jgi:hypothetical protein
MKKPWLRLVGVRPAADAPGPQTLQRPQEAATRRLGGELEAVMPWTFWKNGGKIMVQRGAP